MYPSFTDDEEEEGNEIFLAKQKIFESNNDVGFNEDLVTATDIIQRALIMPTSARNLELLIPLSATTTKRKNESGK